MADVAKRGKLGRGESRTQLSRGERGDLGGFHGGQIRRRQTHHFIVVRLAWLLVNAAAWALVKATIWSVVKPLTTWPVSRRRFDWFSGPQNRLSSDSPLGRGQAGDLVAWSTPRPGRWSRRRSGRWSSRGHLAGGQGGDGRRGQRGKLGRGESRTQLSRGQRGDLAGFHGGQIRRRQTHHFIRGQAGDLVAGYAAAWALVKATIWSVVKPLTTWLVVKAAI